MAGREQPRRNGKPIDRVHRAYRESIREMADSYGFDAQWLATHFEWFTCCRQYEQGMPRNLAAFCAWQDVQAAFLKHGAQEFD